VGHYLVDKSLLSKTKEHIKQFTIIVDSLASSLVPPIIYDSGIKHLGFRYMQPTTKHFCVLMAVRAVSGLNASLILAEQGFNQEMCVLIRTIVECTTKIEFVLAGLDGGILAKKQQVFIDEFFRDFRRNSSEDFVSKTIRQKEIHNEISQKLEEVNSANLEDKLPTELMSNIYRTFSNYVHACYPEVMDMYGGTPLRFHMNGMKGTPKDAESSIMLAAFVDSVGLALAQMIEKFDMADRLKVIPELKPWFPSSQEF